MTPTLRKYHRFAWLFLAAFLPLLYWAAIMVLPKQSLSETAPNYQPVALPRVLESATSEVFASRLRASEATGERQLEIELLRPLEAASALVYLMKNDAQQPVGGQLLGAVGSQNIYRFKVSEEAQDGQYLLLFDPIKNRPIQTLKLAPPIEPIKAEQ